MYGIEDVNVTETSNDTTVGLLITQSMSVLMFLQWAIKVSAEVANQITCVERALEYTNLEPEQQDLGESTPVGWTLKNF